MGCVYVLDPSNLTQDKWPVKPSEANILAQSGDVSFAFTRNFSLPVADSAGNTEQLNILAASLLSLSNLGWSSADVYYRELLDAGTDDQLMSSSMIMMISNGTALRDAFAAIKDLKDPMFYLVQRHNAIMPAVSPQDRSPKMVVQMSTAGISTAAVLVTSTHGSYGARQRHRARASSRLF